MAFISSYLSMISITSGATVCGVGDVITVGQTNWRIVIVGCSPLHLVWILQQLS